MRRISLVCTLAAALAACLPPRDDAPADAGPDTATGSDAGQGEAETSPDAGPGADADAATAAPGLLDDGAPCVAHGECTSGRCAQPCRGYGVCAPAACGSDADCSVPGASPTLCCHDGTCAAIPGQACGDRSGGQGAACGEGGDTACSPGLSCVAPCVATSYCAADCEVDGDCDQADPRLACLPTAGGRRRCLVHPDRAGACTRDGDCGGGKVCSIGLSFDATGIVKSCQARVGRYGAGAGCMDGTQCTTGFCFDGTCTGACDADADCACPEDDQRCKLDQICLDVWFVLYGDTEAPARLCYPAVRCLSSDDCGAQVCAAWPERTGWSRICAPDTPEGRSSGRACQANGGCDSGACSGGICRSVCEEDAHCLAGKTCEPTAVPGSVPEGSMVGLCL